MMEQSMPTFEEVGPLLSKMADEQYALRVARWLAENLKEEEDRIKALEAALLLAARCKDTPHTSQVFSQGNLFQSPGRLLPLPLLCFFLLG